VTEKEEVVKTCSAGEGEKGGFRPAEQIREGEVWRINMSASSENRARSCLKRCKGRPVS